MYVVIKIACVRTSYRKKNVAVVRGIKWENQASFASGKLWNSGLESYNIYWKPFENSLIFHLSLETMKCTMYVSEAMRTNLASKS